MLDLGELAEHLGQGTEAERFRRMHAEMADCVNACAWDGSWYGRAFDDDGRLIGVSSEDRHRINLIPQSWCVIGEVAPRDAPSSRWPRPGTSWVRPTGPA